MKRMATKTAAKDEASTARPVAAIVNQVSEPATKPAMKAGEPCNPRDRTRATRAVDPRAWQDEDGEVGSGEDEQVRKIHPTSLTMDDQD